MRGRTRRYPIWHSYIHLSHAYIYVFSFAHMHAAFSCIYYCGQLGQTCYNGPKHLHNEKRAATSKTMPSQKRVQSEKPMQPQKFINSKHTANTENQKHTNYITFYLASLLHFVIEHEEKNGQIP